MTRPGGAETLPNLAPWVIPRTSGQPARLPLKLRVVGVDESVCLLAGAEGRLPCSK